MLYAIHILRSSVINGVTEDGKHKYSFCIHCEDGRCSLHSHDLVSSSIVKKRVSPHRCSFQMIPERKRVVNLNSAKTNIIKQTNLTKDIR